MHRTLMAALVLVGSSALLQCGGDDASEGDKLCQQVEAKLTECSVTFGAGAQCRADSELDKCLARCVTGSTCDALVDDTATSSFTLCGFACQGAGADWFICADGKKAIEPAGKCNGDFDCGDGSDEADCGAADAGSD